MEKLGSAKERKEYRRLRLLLKRNPHAISKMHEEAFLKFVEMIKETTKKEKVMRGEIHKVTVQGYT